jgi:tetratricopeptide (TPR) repeat protein
VPRDLETICLKCLRKEPHRRYESASALADDLGRYRSGRPVVARPVGRAERAWRWCARNPLPAGLLAALALTLAGGLAGVTALWRQEAAQRHRAEARDGEARRLLGEVEARDAQARRLLGEVVGRGLDHDLRLREPGSEPLRQDLAAAALRHVEDYQALLRQDEHPADPERRAAVRAELARAERWRGGLLRVARSPAEAEPVLRQAVALEEELLRGRPGDRAVREELARAYQDLAFVRTELARHPEALDDLERSRRLLEPAAAGDASPAGLGTLAGSLNRLGLYASRRGDPVRARALLTRACELAERAVGSGDAEPGLHWGLAASYANLANLCAVAGEGKQARELYEKAVAILERLDREHPGTEVFASSLALVCRQLALFHNRQDRESAALTTLARGRAGLDRLMRHSPDVRTLRRHEAAHALAVARVQLKQGMRRAAFLRVFNPAKKVRPSAQSLAAFRAACELHDQLAKAGYADLGPERLQAYTYLGVVQAALEQKREALASFRTARGLLDALAREPAGRAAAPGDQGETAFVLGAGLMNLGEHADALPVFRQAVARQRVALTLAPTSRPLRKELSRSYFHLGEVQRELGRPADAAATCRERQRLWPDDPDEVYDAACELARCAQVAGEGRYADEAMKVLRRAAALGLKRAGEVRANPDFALLRDRAEFKQVVAEVERRDRAGRSINTP